MKYVQINSHSWGWAEEVIFKKHLQLLQEGNDSYVFWGTGKPTVDEHEIRLCNEYERLLDKVQTRFDGKIGFHSKKSTKRLINQLDIIQPDIVHLHSPLGYYLNVEMFFNWLEQSRCDFIWTMHDCWAFTGYCMHFTLAKCDQWKEHCTNNCPCPPRGEKFPDFALKSKVEWNFDKKKEIFTRLPAERVTIITPSKWLADLVRESFLGKYKIEVRNNTINEKVFKPCGKQYRKKWKVNNRFVILGVSSRWGYRKGLQDFEKLLVDLNQDYAIVMVGLEQNQIERLNNICNEKVQFIGMNKTSSREELAEIYSACDVFFNPTLEENYPTVNLEAEACGTPVVTYDTGGCRETIQLLNSKAVTNYEEALKYIKCLKETSER